MSIAENNAGKRYERDIRYLKTYRVIPRLPKDLLIKKYGQYMQRVDLQCIITGESELRWDYFH